MFHVCNYSCCKIARYYFWRKVSCHIWRRRVNVRMKLNAAILAEKVNLIFFFHMKIIRKKYILRMIVLHLKRLCVEFVLDIQQIFNFVSTREQMHFMRYIDKD